MPRRLLTLVVMLFAFAGNAEAATYYVSPNGSDSNAGTSTSAPWRTVTHVDNTALAPGDTVLFQGGQTFTDNTLMPLTSGTAAAPITFASYGSGRATISNANGAVWFSGKSYLTFDNLVLTTSGANAGIFSGSSGTSSYITLERSLVTNSAYSGINIPNSADNHWLIADNTISHVGDSGMIVLGSSVTIRGNTITDTGWNPALSYGKHGIYAKGPDMTIANNDISADTNGSGITLRYHGARVYGNAIHDTPYAFSYFPDDPGTGVDLVYGNRAWGITGFAFYYNGTSATGMNSAVDFVMANNTFVLSNASEAVNVSEVTNANTTIVNNVFAGSYGSALRAPTPVAGKVFTEHNNDWYGGTSNLPNGAGDIRVDPALGAPASLAPSSLSPVVDRGSTSVPGLSYAASCDGQPLDYCGAAPDIGGSEYAAALPVDLTAPSAPLNVAVSQATATSLALSWSASSDANGVAGYEVLANGVLVATTTTPSATLGNLSCGTSYDVAVDAFDAAGNHSTATHLTATTAPCAAAALSDTTPPAVSATAASASNRTIVVTASATDASGVRELRFLLNGRVVCTVSGSSGSCSMSVSGSGWNTVEVDATDNAGNVGSTSLRVKGTKLALSTFAVRAGASAAIPRRRTLLIRAPRRHVQSHR